MSIQLKSLSYETPNGTAVFEKIDLNLDRGTKYGLVGANGVGKTTLAKIIAGELIPSGGARTVTGNVHHFSQVDPDALSHLHLSGGERMMERLKVAMSADVGFIVFDEPTNNLDSLARDDFYGFVQSFPGGLLLISHDRQLLNLVDCILELSNRGLSKFGGNWAFYEEQSRRERARLNVELVKAKARVEDSTAQRTDRLQAQEKRMAAGRAKALRGGAPKILTSAKKRQAQITRSKLDTMTSAALKTAVESTQDALDALKAAPKIYAEFPNTSLDNAKLVFDALNFNFQFPHMGRPLWQSDLTFSMRGPTKLALIGPNGCGKSTLLRLLTKQPVPGTTRGELKLGRITFSILDQSLSLIDDNATVLENVASSAGLDVATLRNLLAQFLFPGTKVFQLAGTLSGGERLRLAIAKTLLQDPPVQLLILDEPTNNIDLVNLEFLEAAIKKYQGALIVVSHDQAFLRNIGIDLILDLGW